MKPLLPVDSLNQIEEWPANNAAAVVVGSGNGVLAHVGDTSRVFELASVTKLLVAYGVLLAVQEGALTLETDAGPPGSTVRHLLAHASGLAFDSPRQQAPVGTQRIYSSAGYEVVARSVEEATGFDFPSYLREAVCAPLGMTHTELAGPAGHGARSSAADLGAFANELLRPRLLDPALATPASRVQFAGLEGFVPGYGKFRPNDWGLGPEIRGTKEPHWTGAAASPDTFGHFGQSGTFLWVDPRLAVSAVVLTDRDFGAWAKPLWSDFNTTLVQALHNSEA